LEPRPERWCRDNHTAPLFILSLKKVLEFIKSADKVTVNGDDRSVRRRLLALKAAPAFQNPGMHVLAGGICPASHAIVA
jgi:hypothetical protein